MDLKIGKEGERDSISISFSLSISLSPLILRREQQWVWREFGKWEKSSDWWMVMWMKTSLQNERVKGES